MSGNFDDAYYAKAMESATPTTLPLIRRSSYLADALRAMQTSTETIRSPGQLIANLLADAIMQHSSNSSMEKLAAAQTGDRASLAALHAGGIFDPPPAAAPAATPGASMADAINPPPQAPAPPQSPFAPTAPQATQSSLSNAERAGISYGPDEMKKLAQMTYGEARGENPAGQQAVAATAINRAANSNSGDGQGQSITDIIAAPNQYEGYNANARRFDLGSPQLQKVMGNLQPMLNGQVPDPSNGATNFYAPGAQAALGRAPPNWDHGNGQLIDHQLFFGGQPQSPPQMVAQNPQTVPQPQGDVQPYQVAANGPTPSPPMQQQPMPMPPSTQGGQPPAAPPSLGAAGGSASIPTGPGPTPQERADYARYMSDPRGYGDAMALADKIAARMRTPIESPKNMMWSAQAGRYMPVPGTEVRQIPGSSPSDSAQIDPFNQITHSSIPGVQGPMPEGTTLLNGAIVKIEGGQPKALIEPADRAKWGIQPFDHNAYAVGADGKVTKTADSPYGPKEIQTVHDNFFASDETKKAMEGMAAFNGMISIIKRLAPNGISNTAEMDSFLRGINPGMGARNSNVTMTLDHIGGISQGVRAAILSKIDGKGYLTPETLQNMVNVVHDYTKSHMDAAAGRSSQDAQMVSKFGYTANDLAENLPTLPPVPAFTSPGYQFGGQNGGAGGSGAGAASGGGAGAGAAGVAGQPTREEVLAASRGYQGGRPAQTSHIRTYNPKTGRLE